MEIEVLKREKCVPESFPIVSCASQAALVEQLIALIGERRALLCTTPSVARLFAPLLQQVAAVHPLKIQISVFNLSERAKSLDAVCTVAAAAREFGIGRRDVLVAIGGGVCSDVVRVAAGLIRRGIAHICVPTTLIGQIDAGIGIKGAVNFEGDKSYLGLFYPPEAALIWPGFLSTLPPAAWRDGLAEAIKLACIASEPLLQSVGVVANALEQNRLEQCTETVHALVRQSIAITASELALDPRELGTLERLLDFGHTFSPLVESRSRHAISHGRSVAIDMALSTQIAKCLGWIDEACASTLLRCIADAGLPIDCLELDAGLVDAAIQASVKHRNGRLNLVVPVGIGRCDFIRDPAILSEALVAEALAELKAGLENTTAACAQEQSCGRVNADPSVLMSITTRRMV